MLRCMDNSIYTGITTDWERRMKEHFEQGKNCAKYTKRHKAESIESVWQTENRVLASRLEYYIKKLSKAKKEELIQKGNLQEILGKKIEINLYEKIKGKQVLPLG